MTIEELLSQISQVPEGSVLVAKPPFTWGSDALFVPYFEGSGIPDSIVKQGYEYLLDRYDIDDLLADVRNKKLSRRAIAEYIIHYSIMDCAPAWINDIPDF